MKEKPIECKTCIGFLQKNPAFGYPECRGIDFVGTCPGTPLGRVPGQLSEENRQVMKFFGLIQIWVFNGFGSYEISAIETAFNIYQIEKSMREPLFERLTIVIQSHAHAKNLENKKKD